jgi:hypothetical protein
VTQLRQESSTSSQHHKSSFEILKHGARNCHQQVIDQTGVTLPEHYADFRSRPAAQPIKISDMSPGRPQTLMRNHRKLFPISDNQCRPAPTVSITALEKHFSLFHAIGLQITT